MHLTTHIAAIFIKNPLWVPTKKRRAWHVVQTWEQMAPSLKNSWREPTNTSPNWDKEDKDTKRAARIPIPYF